MSIDTEIGELKAEGNALLKAGDLKGAESAYSRALDRDLERTHSDAAALLCNRALVHLKLKAHAECIADCTEALKVQPRYGKALYRRAQAREAAGALADAFKDARELLNLEPSNKEAAVLIGQLKRAIEKQNAKGDLSTPMAAVEALGSAASDGERVGAVGKLSRIAEDPSRSKELLHAGAVAAVLALLPDPDELRSAADIKMPLVGLAIETLDRMCLGGAEERKREPEVLRAVGGRGDGGGDGCPTANKALAIAKAAAGARSAVLETEGTSAEEVETNVKNLLLTATRSLTLTASLASQRGACGSQTSQGELLLKLLPFTNHPEEKVQRAALDSILRVADGDKEACVGVLPRVLSKIIFLLGDEETDQHKVATTFLIWQVATAFLARVMGSEGKAKPKKDEEPEEDTKETKALCSAVDHSICPILRNADTEWEEHVAAVHGVVAILEVNKAVGAWLLRQESIFWSLAEVAEMDDDGLQRSLAEVYAHAANDPQHFRDQAGEEPLSHLKTMLRSTKPPIRARACVALAKVALLHHNHRVSINPTGRLLTATLGLLEAKVSPAVHRWAVEAFMYLSVMPDIKTHLVEKEVQFGSLIALSDSVSKDSSLHFSLISSLRRLCVAREKSDDQKRLEQEMDAKQIEQMKQLAAGGAGMAPPSEREDDPEVLRKLAAQLVKDDAVTVIAEITLHAKSAVIANYSAHVLLQMACTVEARGKMVQQGGFKALLSLVQEGDPSTSMAAAWGLAKVGISINPSLYPRRTGSGPEGMVKPLLKLIDDWETELQQFEGCLCLTNLATVPELRDRIVEGKGWRTITMVLGSNNELVQRAAIEALSNLVTNDSIVERFVDPKSSDVKIFVGFCGCDDPKSKSAAAGALATLSAVPEVGAALIEAGVLEPLVEIAFLSDDAGLLHRAAFALQRLLEENADAVFGKKGEPPHELAMPALGAVSTLTKSAVAPARQAAESTLRTLLDSRPDISVPPPELVAQVVSKLKAEAEKRAAEAELEEVEEEAAEQEKSAAAANDDDDDDDDGTMV